MDRFLWAAGRVYGGPISSIGALRLLDEVLAGAQDDDDDDGAR